MAASSRLAALLALPALLLGACGSAKDSAKNFSGDQKAVAQTVEDLQSAGRKGDQDKICDDLLAPVLVKAIIDKSGPCSAALKDRLADSDVFELQVEKVTINGTTATAQVVTDGTKHDQRYTFTLQRVGSAWKISSLGG